MFGIGGGELILIVIIALMLFGTKGLPEAARTFARVMSQLRNATNDIKSEITKEVTESGIGNSVKQITSNFDDEVNQIKNNVAQNIVVKNINLKRFFIACILNYFSNFS